MSLTRDELADMGSRLADAESEPVPPVVRAALVDARRLFDAMHPAKVDESDFVERRTKAKLAWCADRRRLIVLHYQASSSLRETGATFGISRQRVSEIVRQERRKGAA